MTDDAGVRLRPVEAGDLGALRRLNSAAVPAVNELDVEELAWFAEVAHTFLVAEGRGEAGGAGGPVGFLVGLDGPDVGYDSANYRWFCERYADFLYVDRVVVDPAAQGRGFGRSLYEAFVGRADGQALLCAEVNLHPRNDRSLAFHEAFGFRPVGEQDTEGGSKRVVLLVRDL